MSRGVVIFNNMAGSGANTTPGLSVRVSALDAARDGDDNENDNVDDNALVLTCDQLQEVDDFCNQLHGKTDDDLLWLCCLAREM